MTKTISKKYLATMFILSALIIGCDSPSAKIEEAHNEVVEATEELNSAKSNFETELKYFQSESDGIMAENDRKIAALKLSTNEMKKGKKMECLNQISELESKSKTLRGKFQSSKNREDLNSFKTEFKYDVQELENAISDFSKNNIK